MKYGFESVNMKEILADLQEPQYWDILDLIYRSTPAQTASNSYEYFNPYVPKQFVFKNIVFGSFPSTSFSFKEYTFACLLRSKRSKKIIPFYVSKAYGLQHDRRFVFMENVDVYYSLMMLAESSADIYTNQNFNVELHYLELRKFHQPGKNEVHMFMIRGGSIRSTL